MYKQWQREEKAEKTARKLKDCDRQWLISYLYWYDLEKYENLTNEEIKNVLIQYSYDHNKVLNIR